MNRRIFAFALALLLALGGFALAETGDMSQVADAGDMTDVVDVVEPGMVPIPADMLNDGTYPMIVDCSSSMFKIVSCELTVADGAMTAALHMKSDAYPYLFPGKPEEAAASDVEALVALETVEDDFFFTFPVEALDAGVDCAAFSNRKQLWYPRTLLFRSDSLPLEAWKAEALVTAATLGLADGAYTCEAALEGGRATLETPVALTVKDGAVTADIVFSTKKIDYVIVDGEKYLPTNTEGSAAFTVPVAAFDVRLSIVVDSTAIKPATEVQYSMTFDSASLAEAE